MSRSSLKRVNAMNRAFLCDEARKMRDDDPRVSVEVVVQALSTEFSFPYRYVRTAIEEMIKDD